LAVIKYKIIDNKTEGILYTSVRRF